MADGGDVGYSFPVLNSKQIVGYLSDVHIHVSEEVLSDPKQHASQVSMVFEKLVETTMGVTKEEMSQPAFAGLGCLSNPELHDDNITFLALFRNVCKMMKISKIDDFALKDMSDPTRPRLRRQLSAAINFVRFREEKEGMYQEWMARKKRVAEAAKASKLRNIKLNDDLEDVQSRMAEKKKAIEDIALKSKAVKEETADLSHSCSVVREEGAQLKKANFAAKDKVASSMAALKQAEIEKERLQGQVVNSPQRILREVADQQQALDQELADVQSELQNTQKLQQSVVVLGRAKRELVKAAASIEEAGTELSKQESAHKEVKSTQRKIVEKKEEYAARASEISENQRRLIRLEEKLFHLQKQAAFKTEANAGELDAVRTAIMDKEGQWNEAHARLDKAKSALDQHVQEKNYLESQIAEQTRETKHLVQQVGTICRSHEIRLREAMREGVAPSSTVLT
eukprot:jgi/Undpi1/3685/HiC_scaffold_16.g07055.m1